MKCVLFEYSDQKFNTGVEAIDKIERLHSYTVEFTMGAGSGTYVVDEEVYQGTYATTAYKAEVAQWTATGKILRLMNMTKKFDGTQNIVGKTSGASYAITSFDMQKSATDTQASNQLIEQEADAIIDFTEGNPFGSL